MDNPQETDLRWLAGFFDAEGSISFNYKPNIDIVNTCPKTIFHIKKILNDLGMKIEENEREKPSKSSKKKRWDIFLRHENQIQVFIKYVSPFIVGKQKQIDVIKKWYNNKDENTKEKLMFVNQLHNIVILKEKKEKLKQKLKTNTLDKYEDINILNEDIDGHIVPYEFNDLYYAAGLIDGDGCLNLNYKPQKNYKTDYRYTPQILLINTNKKIIEAYISVLKNNSIGYYISFRTASKTTNRRRWDITISGVKRCEKFLSMIYDKLKTKEEQAKLLLEYCHFRLEKPKSINDIGFECKNALETMRK